MKAEELFLLGLDERLGWLLEDYPVLGTPQRAFTAWVLINAAGVPEEEAVEAIVDGPDDKGIDAIYVPEDGDRLVVVQTKLTKKTQANLSRNDVVNTLNGIGWLINGDLSEVDNVLFQSKADEFRTTFLASFPSVEVIIASTSKGPATDGVKEINRFLEEMNPRGGAIFTVECLDIDRLSDIFRRRLQATTPNEIELELTEQPYERAVGDTLVVVGSVAATQIADLVAAHGTQIFEANIRNYLGNVKINKAIVATASDPDQAQNFLFYNNGLTFVCDDLSWRGTRESKRVRLTNGQIVNGCQTATSLHEAATRGLLQEETEVFVRLIQRPDAEFVASVTRNTNSQNAVTPSDLVGSDPVQIRLAEDLVRRGYYYERRRGDFRSEYPKKADRVAAFGDDYASKVITLREAAQAYAASFKQIPVIAKKNTSYLFLGTSERGRYNEIFDDDTTADRLILAVSMYDKIKAAKRRVADYRTITGCDLSWIPQADMFLVGLLYRRNIDPTRIGDTDYIIEMTQRLNEDFDGAYVSLIKDVDEYIDARRRDDPDYNAPTFFKSESGYIDLAKALT